MDIWHTAPRDILNLILSYRDHMDRVTAFEQRTTDWVAAFMDAGDVWDEPVEDTYRRAYDGAKAVVAPMLEAFPASEHHSAITLALELERKVGRWVDVRLDELYKYITRARSPAVCATLMICGPSNAHWRHLVEEGQVELAVGAVWDNGLMPTVMDFVEFNHIRERYIDNVADCLMQSALMEYYVTNS